MNWRNFWNKTLPPTWKDWIEAVTRAADIFGHAISKLLNASNLATLAAKVHESITEHKADNDLLPDRLQLVMKNMDMPEAEFVQCDRVRTAKSVKALLAACDNKEPTALVGAIAQAKLETNSTSMGKGLKSAKTLLDCLRTTKWELFSAVGQIHDHRKTEAEVLIEDVWSWLKTDEHALAGGLASKLSTAEGRAIKLLTPPKMMERDVILPPIDPPKPKLGLKQIGSGGKARMSNRDSISETKSLLHKLEENAKLRLTVQWTLEEESAMSPRNPKFTTTAIHR